MLKPGPCRNMWGYNHTWLVNRFYFISRVFENTTDSAVNIYLLYCNWIQQTHASVCVFRLEEDDPAPHQGWGWVTGCSCLCYSRNKSTLLKCSSGTHHQIAVGKSACGRPGLTLQAPSCAARQMEKVAKEIEFEQSNKMFLSESTATVAAAAAA